MKKKAATSKYEDFKFPYETFPICIQHYDSVNFKICWFQCIDHMDKYIKRHNLKQPDYIARNVWGDDLNPPKPKSTTKRKTLVKPKPKTKTPIKSKPKSKSKRDILTPSFSTIDSFFKKRPKTK